MPNIKLIYTTFSSNVSAKSVVQQLLVEKLIACGNINTNIQSIYEWEGEICCEDEVSVILKTTDEVVDEAMIRLKELHQYKTPCIIVLPLDRADNDFESWVVKSLV